MENKTQAAEDYVKKVDKFILSEIQAKGEICWVLFALNFLPYIGFPFRKRFWIG